MTKQNKECIIGIAIVLFAVFIFGLGLYVGTFITDNAVSAAYLDNRQFEIKQVDGTYQLHFGWYYIRDLTPADIERYNRSHVGKCIPPLVYLGRDQNATK